jgi:RNA polymerase sigma-70 factor, ECF subfamily
MPRETAGMASNDLQRWFMEQVQREHTRLRAFIHCLGVRSEEVDDIAQEVFLLSFKKLDEFDRDGDFGAWVRQFARRIVAGERRKESRRNQLLSDHVTDILLEIDDSDLACVWGEPNDRDELVVLRSCLSKLPKPARDLLHQRYFEELSPGEIGGRLGKTSNQIRQALLRLRRSLLLCMTRNQSVRTA